MLTFNPYSVGVIGRDHIRGTSPDFESGPPPSWEPISTAPKDGCQVWIGWFSNGILEKALLSEWINDYLTGRWLGWWTPTHWRPMP